MPKTTKKVETVGLCYNGIDLPYTITSDGKIFDNEGNSITTLYNKQFGYRAQIIFNSRTKSISVSRALLESFRGFEGSSYEVDVVYLDDDNSNINLDNLLWRHKMTRYTRPRSGLYPYNRSSMESALKILSSKTGTVESAIRQSKLTLEQIKEIVTSSKYRPIRSGYNIKLCKEKLSVY